MTLSREDFGAEFAFGVSAAAFQTEGGSGAHGKGPSIWDAFTQRKGKIRNGEHAEIACDFYHKFPQDLALMSTMNIPNFRFSISWARIYPNGTGDLNKAGIDHYNRMIDFCLELGIEPWVTLYHWDLPLALELKGGWANRDITGWFETYVATCVRAFGDRVKHWIILNEPMVFCGAGYFLGVHAPGRRSPDAFFAAVHHAALCQAHGAVVARSIQPAAKIGTTFSCTLVEPFTDLEIDRAAAMRTDTLVNRLFIEPLLGMGYPVKDLKFLQRLEPYIKANDEQSLKADMDFVGIQSYTRELITHSWMIPFLQAKPVKASERSVERTLMDWEVYPESMYMMLKKFSAYPGIPPIIVTENGAAFEDVIEDGVVNDQRRTEYLQRHLSEVLRARWEGMPVNGYFVWTFTDNFEWAEGYHPRFGIVHVDFRSQKRTVKHSGQWYKTFLATISTETESGSVKKRPHYSQ
jgi:beta-glucosidase